MLEINPPRVLNPWRVWRGSFLPYWNLTVHMKRTKINLPPKGHVCIMSFTDRQFGLMEVFFFYSKRITTRADSATGAFLDNPPRVLNPWRGIYFKRLFIFVTCYLFLKHRYPAVSDWVYCVNLQFESNSQHRIWNIANAINCVNLQFESNSQHVTDDKGKVTDCVNLQFESNSQHKCPALAVLGTV